MLRWRQRAQLMQHTQPIEQPIKFRDLPSSDAVEHETGHGHLPSSRGDPLELTLMTPSASPPLAHAVLFGDQLFRRGMPVGERATKGSDERFEVFPADLPAPRQNDRRISSHQFICCRRVPLVPKLFDKTAHDRLVLFT